MFTITLIARPDALDLALADALRNAWGGGDVVWLSPRRAAEFQVAQRPENFWEVWADMQPLGVDLIPQPATGGARECCWPIWTAR